MLSIMFDRYTGQCDDMLPFVMLANNRSDHESPGVTPAIAMLGRELRLPLDVQIGHPPWGKALGLPCSNVAKNCLHDQHAKELRFSPNDRMWLAMLRIGKLDREWEGPYQVVEKKRYHAKDTTEQLDEGDPSVRDGTTRRKEHQPPGAASPPSSEVRVETAQRRRPPLATCGNTFLKESTGRTSLK
ncbi:hypothetical protein T08_14068 [Trichinella sp. T8]|nr:hypothetical protein T08_14068 [Trichinella sp. T8]